VAAKEVIIIGGGIAGLSAGCYAQMNGYASRIFELHKIPGGLCTSWRRGGYLMDGCLQYLTGSAPPAEAHRMWLELGAVQGRDFYNRDEFIRVEGRDGRALVFYTNADRFEEHLLELAPDDARNIHAFANGIRRFTQFNMPLDWPQTAQENAQFGMRMLPLLLPVLRWNSLSIREFASRFRDPLLREGLPQFFQFAHPTFPMTIMLMTLAIMHNRTAGYPIGGSLRFALSIAKRYEDLAGQIECKARVAKILVENDRAVGVRMADGTEHRADVVISAADGYDTIFTMLEGKYCNEKIRRYYKELPIAGPIVQVSLGVNRDLRGTPPMVNFPLPRPVNIAGKMHDRLVVKHYGYDPTSAPEGKSAVTLWLDADYDYWKGIYDKKQVYEAEQDEVADIVIDELERRWPGLKAQVEIADVATPPTYERFTENWRGAIAGWSITSRKMGMMMGKGMSKQLPGLENFYMIGQWVEPGGNVQLSAASGRDAIKLLCRADGKPFETSQPAAEPPAPVQAAPEETVYVADGARERAPAA
jgi:phytoene dehydrogenase-like protein